MSELKEISSSKCYGGYQKVFHHTSSEVRCAMKFSVFLPPQVAEKKCPVLYWLSGLTCTEQNFIVKSGFQRHAAEHGLIVVGPDTSPRECNIHGEEDSWDYGTGAGFYLDALTDLYKDHYRMYSYVLRELPPLIDANFPTNGKMSITGHSMGGHGAITIALKNPEKYVSVSAFSPICNPMEGPWGSRALKGYLGDDKSNWEQYDSCHLAKSFKHKIKILVDQGSEDEYLKKELMPERFVEACNSNPNISLTLRMLEGYDHSFYFVSTFLGDHFEYHAKALNK